MPYLASSPLIKVFLRVTHYRTLSFGEQRTLYLVSYSREQLMLFLRPVPNITFGGTAHAIFASSSHPQCLANCLTPS